MSTRPRAKRLALAIAIVLAAIVTVVGKVTVSKNANVPLESLVLGDAGTVLAAPLWIAEAKGLFREEGLDVTVRHFELGGQAFADMLAGGVDVAAVSATPIVVASFTRQDFVVFGNISYGDNHSKIVARRDRGIREASDLKGKTIGVARGTSAEYFLETFIVHFGVPRNSLTIKHVDQAEMPEALSRGDVDAVAAFEPLALKVQRRLGSNAAVISARNVYRETFSLTTHREFAKAHPDALIRLLRAVRQAERFIHSHVAETQAIMAQRSGLSSAEVATIMPDFTFALSLHQSLLPLFEDKARWVIRSGQFPATRIPNYLDLMYPGALNAVDPKSVTIIH